MSGLFPLAGICVFRSLQLGHLAHKNLSTYATHPPTAFFQNKQRTKPRFTWNYTYYRPTTGQHVADASQKHAIVTPRLKRSGLDPTDIANFRPVSNLTFMSKVIERAAASQLNTYTALRTA